MSETPTNSTVTMTRDEEEEEVRTLLERHQERIIVDLGNTDLLAVLVKNSVLTQSEEDLLLKPLAYAAANATTTTTSAADGNNGAVSSTGSEAPGSAPPSVGVVKRKLTKACSNASAASSTVSGAIIINNSNTNGTNSLSSSTHTDSPRSASVNSDPTTTASIMTDNRSVTPSVVSGAQLQQQNSLASSDTNSEHQLYLTKADMVNDADLLRIQCANLIEIIAKNGFEKFKQFCYAIENECPQLIEDLINDRLKCGKSNLGEICMVLKFL